MNTSKEQHKKLRFQQYFLSLMGAATLIIYVYIALKDDWPKYILVLTVIGIGVLLIFSVRNIKTPVLCSNCNEDLTRIYDHAICDAASIKYCPFCGHSQDE